MARRRKGTQSSDRKVSIPPYRKDKEIDVKEDEFPKGKKVMSALNCQTSRRNDPRWYAHNDQLLKDAASFPYSWPLGNRLSTGIGTIDNGSIPGVMCFYVSQCFGSADNPNSPVNVAARNIYSYVRHANSGHANYDAPDLMLYLLAMDSAYSYHSFLKRVYGVMRDYTETNRYYPSALVQMMGVEYTDIMANLAQLRYYINQYAVKIGSMCIPNSMSYMARHMWMYEGLYVDGTGPKAQTYLFAPHAFYKYQLDEDSAGMLSYTLFNKGITPGTTLTYEDLVNFGDNLINPILQSEDMNIMSGDILKAFGENGVFKVSGVSEDYTVLPVYDQEVLSQIENITLLGYYNTELGGIDLKQDATKGFLTYNPEFVHPLNQLVAPVGTSILPWSASFDLPWTSNRVVTFHKSDVSPADTMVATRLTNIISYKGNTGFGFGRYCTTAGSEIVHSAIIAEFQYSPFGYGFSPYIYVGSHMGTAYVSTKVPADSTITVQASTRSDMGKLYSYNLAQMRNHNLRVCQLSVFDWHPPVYPYEFGWTYYLESDGTLKQQGNDIRYPVGWIQDVETYTVMTKHDLERMAEVALLSEFSVPQMGAFSTKI